MRYYVTIGDRTVEVDLGGDVPRVDGEPVEAALEAVPGTAIRHMLADGRSVPLVATPGDRKGRWQLQLAGARLVADAVDERTRAIREMSGAAEETAERSVIAPMPGLVVRVEVEVGEQVRAGQGVVVVEAMKMENELKAPADGTVAEIRVQPGATVDRGAVLLVLE